MSLCRLLVSSWDGPPSLCNWRISFLFGPLDSVRRQSAPPGPPLALYDPFTNPTPLFTRNAFPSPLPFNTPSCVAKEEYGRRIYSFLLKATGRTLYCATIVAGSSYARDICFAHTEPDVATTLYLSGECFHRPGLIGSYLVVLFNVSELDVDTDELNSDTKNVEEYVVEFLVKE